jgi:hypothetical protein
MGNLPADSELASQKNSCAMEFEFKNVLSFADCASWYSL